MIRGFSGANMGMRRSNAARRRTCLEHLFNWVAVRIRVTTRQINTFIVAAWPKSSLDNLKRRLSAQIMVFAVTQDKLFLGCSDGRLFSDVSIRSSCHLAVSTVKYKGHGTSTQVALSAACD